METQPLRVLIVGLGNQGRKRRLVAGPEAVATVDPLAEGATYREVSQAPLDSYDAALVCTPDEAKVEILDYLLGHGKHVLVEKPLLGPDERLRELDRSARRNGVALYTAYNHRFEPHIARLKDVLDAGTLGSLYTVRIFYGNGTARDVRNSGWRDQGMGVLPDLGSHLLDMVHFLFGERRGGFRLWSAHCWENRALDHVHFAAEGQPSLQLEAALLSWRNTFTLDILAERGSAHIDCLCKWGPSTLTLRRRILPSGAPEEERQVLVRPDPTWVAEYAHFKALCQEPSADVERDIWIQSVLRDVYAGVGERGTA
jgi:scyllo-inositol 2-dehydrogenase (NADP+)